MFELRNGLNLVISKLSSSKSPKVEGQEDKTKIIRRNGMASAFVMGQDTR